MNEVLKWLEATALATEIRENELLFPSVESFHVLAITAVVGLISIVDLRLLGFASMDRAADRLTRDVLPLTWIRGRPSFHHHVRSLEDAHHPRHRGRAALGQSARQPAGEGHRPSMAAIPKRKTG